MTQAEQDGALVEDRLLVVIQQRDALLAALKPFAGMAFDGTVWETADDDSLVLFHLRSRAGVTLGDFKAAEHVIAQCEAGQ
jgi:hypothetical protein